MPIGSCEVDFECVRRRCYLGRDVGEGQAVVLRDSSGTEPFIAFVPRYLQKISLIIRRRGAGGMGLARL
jgi:hypothetical protein